MGDFLLGAIIGLLGYGILFWIMWAAVGKAIWGELFAEDHIPFYAVASALIAIVSASAFMVNDAAIFGVLVSVAVVTAIVILKDKEFKREDAEKQEKDFEDSKRLYMDAVKGESLESLAKKSPKKFREIAGSLPDLAAAYSADEGGFIAIRKNNREVILSDGQTPLLFVKSINILSVEIIENESVLTTSKSQSPISRAVVGGLLAGGAGAIVGAVSASSKITNETTVTKLALRLIINDEMHPSVEIKFLWYPYQGISKSDTLYSTVLRRCQEYHARIHKLIRKDGEKESSSPLSSAVDSKARRREIEGKLLEMTVNEISEYTNSSRRATIAWLTRHGKSCKDYDGSSK